MPRCRQARCRARRGCGGDGCRGLRPRFVRGPPVAASLLVGRAFAINLVLPAAILALTIWLAGRHSPVAVNIALSLSIVAAIGLFLYRIAFQPIAHASCWCC